MIAIFTKPDDKEFISWVRHAVKLADLDEQQVEVVPLDGDGYLEVQGYVKVIKEAEACVVDLDKMNVMGYMVEMSSLGEGISYRLRRVDREATLDPSIIDPRLMLVTRELLDEHLITRYFKGLYSSISAKDGFADEITEALAVWLKETVHAAVPRVFISYRSQQQEFADRVVHSLKGKGVFVWFDKFDIVPGDSIPEAVNRGLAWCTHLVLLVDETFFDSRWTRAEVESVLYRHLSGMPYYFRGTPNPRPLIPLFLVDPNSKAIPPMLQRIRGIDCRSEEFSKIMETLWHAITAIGPR